MKPLVSILIPTYNAEKWIVETLQSAIDQNYSRKEIILVNDGSTDRTLELARTLASNFVKIIDQPNAGSPAARNTALAYAQGDYIQWLDHDDLLSPNKISVQLQEQERIQNDRILLSCQCATFYYRVEKAKLCQSPLCRDLKPVEYFYTKFLGNTYLQTSAWLVSRKLSELAGPWWNLRSRDDDGEYFCRVVAASEGIRFVPGVKTYWRVGNSGSLSWAWTKSPVARNRIFQSTLRCIEHFRKLEDNEASRAACVQFLHDRLPYFYPDDKEMIKEMQALARQLGGVLNPPPLRRKYKWVGMVFGASQAHRAQLFAPTLRSMVESTYDKLLYKLYRQKSQTPPGPQAQLPQENVNPC